MQHQQAPVYWLQQLPHWPQCSLLLLLLLLLAGCCSLDPAVPQIWTALLETRLRWALEAVRTFWFWVALKRRAGRGLGMLPWQVRRNVQQLSAAPPAAAAPAESEGQPPMEKSST